MVTFEMTTNATNTTLKWCMVHEPVGMQTAWGAVAIVIIAAVSLTVVFVQSMRVERPQKRRCGRYSSYAMSGFGLYSGVAPLMLESVTTPALRTRDRR